MFHITLCSLTKSLEENRVTFCPNRSSPLEENDLARNLPGAVAGLPRYLKILWTKLATPLSEGRTGMVGPDTEAWCGFLD